MTEEKPKSISVPDTIIDKETATNEFDRWVESMRIKIDRSGLDENERRDILEDKETIIREIMDGRIIIDDNGLLMFKAEEGPTLTFHRPKGGDLVVMDKKKKHADLSKINASMAAVCRVPEVTFTKLYANDLQLCQLIWSLFLV